MKKRQKQILGAVLLIVIGLIVINQIDRPLATSLCPSGEKYCSSLTPNARYVCNPSTGVATKYYCPSGQLCESGECKDDENGDEDKDDEEVKEEYRIILIIIGIALILYGVYEEMKGGKKK